MSAAAFLIGRGPDGADQPVAVTDGGAVKVDIAGATLELDADGVEIKNDEGNPVPVAGTELTSLNSKTPALQSGAVPVGDNSSSLTVDGKAYRSSVTITRPSNTTAYAAGDVIGVADGGTPANAGSAVIQLTNVGPGGGYVLVQSVRLLIGNTSVPSGMGAFRLHLYTAAPTAILDNAAFGLAGGEVSSYVGYVDLQTPQDFGSVLFAQADYVGTLVNLASASTTLWAELETRGAYTPASGTTYDLRVMTLEAGL